MESNPASVFSVNGSGRDCFMFWRKRGQRRAVGYASASIFSARAGSFEGAGGG